MVRRNKVYSLCWRSKPYKQNIHFIKHNEQKGLVTMKFCKVNRNKEGDHQMHILGSFRKKKSRLCQRCTRRCNDINRVVHFNQRWCNIIVHDKNKTCSALFSRHTTGVCFVQCKRTYKLTGVQVNISQSSTTSKRRCYM